MSERIGEVITGYLREEREIYKDYVPQKAILYGEELYKVFREAEPGIREETCKSLLPEVPYEYPHPTVWWYSVLCSIYKDPIIFSDFIKYVRDHKGAFSANTLYYLFSQLAALEFQYKELGSEEGKSELWKLLLEIVEEFKEKVNVSLETIPLQNRNSDLIIVLTQQMIAIQHGPTKTALDRCKAIRTALHKNVLLINGAELLSMVGRIPFMEEQRASYDAAGIDEEYKEWQGVRIPYFQCKQDMPKVDMLNILLAKIRELAPCRIISIGGKGILSSLADKIVPTITVGLMPSGLEYTDTAFQTLGRRMTVGDRALLKKIGLKEDHVIESIFTSSLKPQTEKITKKELGIGEDRFLLIVVGGAFGCGDYG